jgi:protein-S-isoprenylcysteine O-methyltransferase Ste14
MVGNFLARFSGRILLHRVDLFNALLCIENISHSKLQLFLRCVLAIYSALEKVRRSFDVVDIPSVCRVSHLTSCILMGTILFWSVVTKSCVWKPVRLKTGRIVMWSLIFGKVMKWSTAGAVRKERESISVLD